MKRVLFILLLLPLLSISQTGNVSGTIKTNTGEFVVFANILVNGTEIGTVSNEQGKYNLTNLPIGKQTLVVSALGYKTRKKSVVVKENESITIDIVTEVTVENLNEVVITGTLREVSLVNSAVPIEVYTPTYFKKNPTASLFQALQIVNGVRPQINCSVCNTGDVHINGMEGPYTMITIDGMPIIGGLASVYGLNGIPNSMIQQMEVVKGPASTLFGSEAVGGLINVITKAPKTAPLFSFDVMSSSWGEINTDLSTRFNVGKSTSVLGVNYFNYSNPIDNNGDNFTDVTLSDRISVFNKWSFSRKSKKLASMVFRYIYEDRWGGQMQFDKDLHRGGEVVYGESIFTSRYEVIGKYQLPFSENVFLSFSYSDHYQNSMYGTTSYVAGQNIAYAQLHWDKRLGKSHNLLFGAAYRYTYYDDNTTATFSENQLNPVNEPDNIHLPGLFVQDEINLNKKNKFLVGIRYDSDSRHGDIFTPRASYRWRPNDNNTLRFSYGTGYRVVNLFTEDHAATIGARTVEIQGKLNPERSQNANIHFQKYIATKIGFIDFNMSLFYTYFSNKITPDYETDSQKIIYANSDGHAISQGVSFNLLFNLVAPLKIKFGGTFLDVYEMTKDDNGVLVRAPQLLTEKVSGTYTISYHFYESNIKVDYSGNLYGPMKLPTVDNDIRPEYSPWYSIQNIQITKTFSKKWEVYGGLKNLLNFTPRADSILNADKPFDDSFDPTYVYAPNQGRRGFLGVRYSID